MSYKREQFIENIDNIMKDINEIFILDRGTCVLFQKISRGMEALV